MLEMLGNISWQHFVHDIDVLCKIYYSRLGLDRQYAGLPDLFVLEFGRKFWICRNFLCDDDKIVFGVVFMLNQI